MKLGKIFSYNEAEGKGVIFLGNGDKYNFGIDNWNDSENMPKVGELVIVEDGKIRIISKDERDQIIAKDGRDKIFTKKDKEKEALIATLKEIEDKFIEQKKNSQKITFEELKDFLLKYYSHKGYTKVVIDNESSWMLKNKNIDKSYINIKCKDSNNIRLDFFNVKSPKNKDIFYGVEVVEELNGETKELNIPKKEEISTKNEDKKSKTPIVLTVVSVIIVAVIGFYMSMASVPSDKVVVSFVKSYWPNAKNIEVLSNYDKNGRVIMVISLDMDPFKGAVAEMPMVKKNGEWVALGIKSGGGK